MTIVLDHTIVPARDKEESAHFFARIFGLPYEGGGSHFAEVRVNDSLTLHRGRLREPPLCFQDQRGRIRRDFRPHSRRTDFLWQRSVLARQRPDQSPQRWPRLLLSRSERPYPRGADGVAPSDGRSDFSRRRRGCYRPPPRAAFERCGPSRHRHHAVVGTSECTWHAGRRARRGRRLRCQGFDGGRYAGRLRASAASMAVSRGSGAGRRTVTTVP